METLKWMDQLSKGFWDGMSIFIPIWCVVAGAISIFIMFLCIRDFIVNK